MNKQIIIIILITVSFSQVLAQEIEIHGRITSADEQIPLPGVSILIKGTTSGTITDMDGNYKIAVQSGATLRFSYIGYTTQETIVENQNVIDIILNPDVSQLREVVITSLGIERQVKALGYSITELNGAELTEALENNLANALTGRIAGVNVSSVAGGPASSTRVIIRGNKSLTGDNQPLYVVDGIPISNINYGQAGIWGGYDLGDGMTSINPDDIESIEVLKGASSSALYGSRAANGVINITTKKGRARKGIGVEFLSNFVFETIYDQRDYQREYGQGNIVLSDPLDFNSERIVVAPRTQQEAFYWGASSWGPRLDNLFSAIQLDGLMRLYADAGDQWSKFFKTGTAWTNTLALSGGNPSQNFRFSVSDLRNTSVVPNSGYKRFNTSLSTNSKFGKKLTLTAKILYSYEDVKNRPWLSDSPGNALLAMHYIPANIDVDWYRGDPDKLGAIPEDQDATSLNLWGKLPGEEFPVSQNNWHQNPWWSTYQFEHHDINDRIITSGQLRFDITDFLYIQGRIGMDWSTRRDTWITPQGTSFDPGQAWEWERNDREINMDYQVGFNDIYGPISVNAFVGGNWMQRKYEIMEIGGHNFNVPFFEAVNNVTYRDLLYGYQASGINSLFGQAEIGYDGFIFFTATGRNDWFSVLNPAYNSIFYPSVGLSFVFTDIINALPSWLSFGKIRTSWARAGNVTVGPYTTNISYSFLNHTHLGYSMASFSTATYRGGLIPNSELKPLLSTEIEYGIDIRFFNNRLGLDFTYYNQISTNDMVQTQVSRASGFGSTYQNVGEVRNEGVEVLLNGRPVQGSFNWDISLNFARNRNKVVSLAGGMNEMTIGEPRNRNVYVKHIVGQPYGMITGRVQKISPPFFDPEYGCIMPGQPIFFSDGRMDATDEYVIIGNGNPDWTGGIMNSFTFANFNLSFLVDFKIGGDIVSGTNMRMTAAGLHKQTLAGREDGSPLTVSGVTQTTWDSEGNPVYTPFEKTLTPAEAQAYWQSSQSDYEGITDMYLYDGSFAKLRQLTFGYNFPSKLLSKSPFTNLSLSVVGRNLLILWKNVENIDPESAYNNTNAQGLEYFAMPAVRSYGFNMKVEF